MKSKIKDQNKSSIQKTRSTVNLFELRKVTQNNQFLRDNFMKESQRINRVTISQNKGGKLHLGHNAKPILVLSKQQRKDPFAKKNIISEDILEKKGIMQLTALGIISKTANCSELLNNRYQVIVEKQQQPDAFMTNPILINTYYESNKRQEQQEQKVKEKIQNKVKIRTKKKKSKLLKPEEPKFDYVEDKIKLNIVHFYVEKSQMYFHGLKRARLMGLEVFFKVYVVEFQKFALKYNLKKITFTPNLNETRKITDKSLLNAIENHKIYGIDLKVKGKPQQILLSFLKMKASKIKFSQMLSSVNKINYVKIRFRNIKFYKEMLNKRQQYIKFKFGSFAQTQRRFMVQEQQRNEFDVEIHVIGSSQNYNDLESFYKYQERKNSHLTRIFNNESSNIIILATHPINIEKWLQINNRLPNTWKKSSIYVYQTTLNRKNITQCDDIYLGLRSQQIRQIKSICDKSRVIVYGLENSIALSFICEYFGGIYSGGNFSNQSLKIINQEEDTNMNQTTTDVLYQVIKFKKIKNVDNLMRSPTQKLKNSLQLSSGQFQSKLFIKNFLQQMNYPTPIWLTNHSKNTINFYQQLTNMIVANKNQNYWVLKLNNSRFSRGVAFLQTQSLKIIKQAKRKQTVQQSQLNQITNLLEQILIQKLMISHSSLMNGQQFMEKFKMEGGYIQPFVENSKSIAIFGKIQNNGCFYFLGSYRKHICEKVCFGVRYPASEVTKQLIHQLQPLSIKMKNMNILGYITFEFLYEDKNKKFQMIDIIPHLQQYSSFYFMYKRQLDINVLDFSSFNHLSRHIFYCPFIDNNANKCESTDQFQHLLKQKKIGFNSQSVQGQQFIYLNGQKPDVLSMICYGKDQISIIRQCLEGFLFLVDIGGQFNKFDKKYRFKKSDGLYVMDIIWRLRQIKKIFEK